MAKVDTELVKMILSRNDLDIRVVSQIMEDIQVELKNQVDEEKPPAVKKQFIMLVSDPEGELEGKDYTGWILQIPEDDSPYTVTDRIIKAAYDYNASPKGRRIPVQTVGEACEVVSAKFFKEYGTWVKTKEPILLIKTDNDIPSDFGPAQTPE